MRSSESIEAFYNINQRFNGLVLQSCAHFNLPKTIPKIWLIQNFPSLQHTIRVLAIDVQMLPLIFPNIDSFSYLHSVILKQESMFAIELQVTPATVVNSIISCLKLCQGHKLLPNNEINSCELWPFLQAYDQCHNYLKVNEISIFYEICIKFDFFRRSQFIIIAKILLPYP